jgi:Iap family predicted aminopeptidase
MKKFKVLIVLTVAIGLLMTPMAWAVAPEDVYGVAAPGEAEVVKKLNSAYGWDIARKLTEISSSQTTPGWHMGGTPEGKQAAELAYNEFAKMGYSPQYKTFPVYGWNFKSATFYLHGDSGFAPVAVAQPGSAPTTVEGIDAELVFVGDGSSDTLDEIDVKGKIAVLALDFDIFPWMGSAAYQLHRRGAKGVIYYAANYYGQHESGEAYYVADWIGPEIDMPMLNLAKKDGEALAKMLTESTKPITGTMAAHIEVNPNATGYNVVAKLPGKKYPDQYIIISGHTDAYHGGFQDDALAVGLILTLAKAMKEANYQPDRTIIFTTVDAEEFGAVDTYYDWLIGSWNLAKEMDSTWGGKVVGNINLELMASVESPNFAIRSSQTLKPYVKAVTESLTYPGFPKQEVIIKASPTTWSDEWSFAYHGIPSMRTMTEPWVTKNIYHSPLDNEASADPARYADLVKAYSTLLMRMDKSAVAPYDLSSEVASFYDELDTDALKMPNINGSLEKISSEYLVKARALNEKNLEIAKLYNEARMAGKDLTEVDKMLAVYNFGQMGAARSIIMGLTHLDMDSVAYRTPYYQATREAFVEGAKMLKKGDATGFLDNFEVCGYSSWYATTMDYVPWLEIYKEPIGAEAFPGDMRWATGRALKYYDIYGVMANVKAKKDVKRADFSQEIKLLEGFAKDAESRLIIGYYDDAKAIKAAHDQLPLTQADAIITALK